MLTLHPTRVLVAFGALACLALPAAAQCPPATPGGMSASNGTQCNGVFINWSDVSGATSYEVRRSQFGQISSAILIGSPTSSQYTDVTALPGVDYYYWVRAFRAACLPGNNFGPWAGPNLGWRGSEPPLPANLQATVGNCSAGVEITWDGTGSSNTQVFRDTTNVFPGGIPIGVTTSQSWTDHLALPHTVYYYWVRTSTVCGTSSNVGPVVGIQGAVLGAPANVSATLGPTCGTAKISWDPPPAGVPSLESYTVLRASSDLFSAAQVLAQVPATQTSHVDATVQAGSTVYYYWVVANNDCGPGLPNNPPAPWEFPSPLAITQHPLPAQVYQGEPVSFSVTPSGGAGALSYEWRRNGELVTNGGPVSGATSAQLAIDPVSAQHAGAYTATVTDWCDSLNSDPATLTVLCYPDCNANGALTVADFVCFQTKFVAADPYADCNASGTLTVADFVCFQTQFVSGCP